MKTIIFEKVYKTNIANFNSTTDIDYFLEKKLGRKLKVVKTRSLDDIIYLDK